MHTRYRAAAPLIFYPGRFGDLALMRPWAIDSAGNAHRGGEVFRTQCHPQNRIICARSQQRLNRRPSTPSRRLARSMRGRSVPRSLSAMSKNLASWPPMRSWRVPTRPCRARFSVHGFTRAVIGHRRQVRGPVSGRPAAPGSGLSFGLIHSCPQTFTGDRGHPVRAGHEHRRTVVNGGAQYSKACEGATPPWVQIPPPPPLTCKNTDPGRRQAGASGSPGLIWWAQLGTQNGPITGLSRRCRAWSRLSRTTLNTSTHAPEACVLPFRAGGSRPDRPPPTTTTVPSGLAAARLERMPGSLPEHSRTKSVFRRSMSAASIVGSNARSACEASA